MLQLLPPTATADSRLLLAARGLRAANDGFVSIILPAYLLLLGFDALHVSVLATATLLGSLAPLVGGESWGGTPLGGAVLGAALLTISVGAGLLASSPAVAQLAVGEAENL